MERVKLITEIQADFNRSLTFEVLQSAKERMPELFYDLKEFPAINTIYGRIKLPQESTSMPEQYEHLMRRALFAIEQAIYEGTFNGLIIEDAAPDNMKKQVHSLVYKEKQPKPGSLIISG